MILSPNSKYIWESLFSVYEARRRKTILKLSFIIITIAVENLVDPNECCSGITCFSLGKAVSNQNLTMLIK